MQDMTNTEPIYPNHRFSTNYKIKHDNHYVILLNITW